MFVQSLFQHGFSFAYILHAAFGACDQVYDVGRVTGQSSLFVDNMIMSFGDRAREKDGVVSHVVAAFTSVSVAWTNNVMFIMIMLMVVLIILFMLMFIVVFVFMQTPDAGTPS